MRTPTRIRILLAAIASAAVSVTAMAATGLTAATGVPPTVTFLQLGTPLAGNWRWCSNCAATAPCTGGGSGAFAYRVGSVWNCNAGTPASTTAQVNLQSSTPGTAQTGHLNISGTAIAGAFTGNLTGNVTGNVSGSSGSTTTATNATNVATTSVSSNAEYRPLFVSSTTNSNQSVKLNASGLTYNPSTDTLTATIFNGQANTALSATSAGTASGSTGDFLVGSGTLFFIDSSTNSIAFTTIGPVFTRAIGGDPLVWTIDMSLITSGSPRAVAVPDASGTMVLDTAAQALTNKTLTDAKTGGSTPAVSNTTANSCGTTTAAIAGNNTTGVVTVGATAGTNCTITFTVAAPTRRQCTVTNETTANLSRSTFLTTTTSTVEGTFVAGDKISYVCAVY